MSRPLIQIDDEVREMTDDEYAQYLAVTADAPDSTVNPASPSPYAQPSE